MHACVRTRACLTRGWRAAVQAQGVSMREVLASTFENFRVAGLLANQKIVRGEMLLLDKQASLDSKASTAGGVRVQTTGDGGEMLGYAVTQWREHVSERGRVRLIACRCGVGGALRTRCGS